MWLCYFRCFVCCVFCCIRVLFFFFQAEDGIRDLVRSRGLGDVYKRQSEYLRLTLTVLTQTMLTTIVLGSVGAVVQVLITERRLRQVNRSITDILGGELSRRIPVTGGHPDDDYTRLIVHFNHMLDRIAPLLEGLTQLSDNIAHDLRTPLPLPLIHI